MNHIIVDFRINEEELLNLKKLNYNILICPPSNLLYDAISGHPDILMHIIDEKNVIVHKDMDKDFVFKLSSLGLNVHISKNSLKNKYPEDIILNCFSLGNLFVHNTRYTDPTLLSKVKSKKLINVKQGYTKCSTAIVNDRAIITSDKNISSNLKKEGVDVLLVPPGDIILPGLNYGFIGGCCGLLDKNTLAFYGDLNYYAYGKDIIEFLKKYNVKPVFLRKGKLIDRGSLLTING